MKYNENVEVAKPYKKEYLQGFDHVIKSRQKIYESRRDEYSKNIFQNSEKYRNDLRKMLGWPLVDYQKNEKANVKSELLSKEDGYEIYRMQFEILDGLYMTGLLFKQTCQEKAPLVIVQHGGLGTPELISGVYGGTSNYNNMLQRVREKGVHVFAPQLLLWNEIYGDSFDRKNIDGQLKRVGSSITAVELFGITSIIDHFEKEDFVSSFGMVGMSYGGFFTIYTSALDERIKSAISCSFFNTRDEVCWADWAWLESAGLFDDAEVSCLVYPRRLCLRMGDKDELFDSNYSIKSFDKIKSLCKDVGTDWVDFEVFDGTHEFFKDDDAIDRLVSDLK